MSNKSFAFFPIYSSCTEEDLPKRKKSASHWKTCTHYSVVGFLILKNRHVASTTQGSVTNGGPLPVMQDSVTASQELKLQLIDLQSDLVFNRV